MELTYNGKSIAEEMVDMFNNCTSSYCATLNGCEKIVETWKQNKGDRFDELFKNIPGYNAEQHCIVLDRDIYRAFDRETVLNFLNYLFPLIECREKTTYNGKNLDEWLELDRKYKCILDMIRTLPATVLNAHGVEQIKAERKVTIRGIDKLSWASKFTPETVAEFNRRYSLLSILTDYHDQYIDEETCNRINEIYPEIKAHAGKKTSKIVRRFCEITGIKDKDADFERRYALYADAINPIVLDETMIISWNPLDYLTQSNGNSWTSCHNIGFGDGEYGCYSSGTLSYMLDESSLVIYVIDKKFVNDSAPYWTHSKIHRQMFHINAEGTTILQGRLYPDDQSDYGRETDFSSYKQYREIVEDVVSTAFGLTNSWTNKRGTSSCVKSISKDYGTHYRDYSHYDNVNVSYNKEAEVQQNLHIGHNPICPSCGNLHCDERCTDDSCWDNGPHHVCRSCGDEYHEDDMHLIDGNWYCSDCSFWCEYHGRWEVGDPNDCTYIEKYGYVCDDALERLQDDDQIVQCEQCEDWIKKEDAYWAKNIETEDIYYFDTMNCRDRWLNNQSDAAYEVM